MVLSIGSLVDLSKPLGNVYGEAYHHLARAAVCERPLMEEPDFDVLHTLVRELGDVEPNAHAYILVLHDLLSLDLLR
jgi:hypothetical protein